MTRLKQKFERKQCCLLQSQEAILCFGLRSVTMLTQRGIVLTTDSMCDMTHGIMVYIIEKLYSWLWVKQHKTVTVLERN